MTSLFRQVKETFRDLNSRWGTLGVIVILSLGIASVIANLLQIISYFPTNEKVEIPLAPLAIFSIILVSAIASLALQLRTSDVIIKKRGATPLTDVFVIRNKGELYYGTVRNILVNLETIQQIFAGVLDEFKVNSGEDVSNNALQKIGKRVGLEFADQFVDYHAVKENDLRDMIDVWCDYDVEAGWGKFIFLPGPSEFTGKIQVRSNFLTSRIGKDAVPPRLCGFLLGYISGILTVFARFQYPLKAWDVEVIEHICGTRSSGQEPCDFNFIIRENTSLAV